MSRKLVTIRKIDEVHPIENADNIEAVSVDGWNIVSKKGEFHVGDYCVMFEIDSFLPIDDERYEFLKKSSYKKMNGVEGIRLKTIKLRGVVSQGLVLPIVHFPEIIEYTQDHGGVETVCEERHDLSDLLGVVKYEIPDTGSGARPAGDYPSYIPKTDEERCISGGTTISTDKGNIPIEIICENNLEYNVKSLNHENNEIEFRKVLSSKKIQNESKKWLKIKTKSGYEIIVTKDHRIYSATKGKYINAENCDLEDEVIIE